MFSTEFLHVIREEELKTIEGNLRKDASILEIGGGTGLQAKILAERGFNITSIDVAHSNYAAQRVYPVIDYDGENIPFPDASFDIVFSSNTLEHIRDIDGFLKEIARVLKPGGYCIHIMPSGSWRFWTSATHYVDLLQRVLSTFKAAIPHGLSRGELMRPLRWIIGSAKTIGANLRPQRHGEAGSVWTEVHLFSRKAWKVRFEKAHFQVEQATPMGLFYTGYMFFGPKISLAVRRRLGKILGSACILYKCTPLPAAGSVSAGGTSPVNFAAIATHFKSFSMVHPSGIAFAAEQAAALIEKNIPGVYVECGCWKGGCSMAMLEAQRKTSGKVMRHVHMLDSFEGLPPVTEKDGTLAHKWQNNEQPENFYNNCSATEQELRRALSEQGFTSSDFTIHKGWFADTVPPLAEKLKGKGIALLRLDGDWYDSTMVCLENLEPLVPEDGIIIIDDYYAWDGCARAVHDYLSRKDLPYRIKSLPYFYGAYMVKKRERTRFTEF